MKKIFLAYIFLLSSLIAISQTKGFVDKQTKEFHLTANIKKDHKFFGYSNHKTTSKKLICFSVFTSDVEGNPYHCPLGAYYQTIDLKEGDKIFFVNFAGSFAK